MADEMRDEQTATMSECDANMSEGNANMSEGNANMSEGNANMSEGNANMSEGNAKMSEGDPSSGTSTSLLEEGLMDSSAVAPPASAAENAAFADALARARQIAAKINPSAADKPASLKRPYDEPAEYQPEAKKLASLCNPDYIGAQMTAIHKQNMADQQRAQQAAQAAANAAAQINAKLGVNNQAGSPPPQMAVRSQMGSGRGGLGSGGGGGLGSGGLGLGGGMGGGMVHSENFSVPNRMVGLVIGKGGETLSAIQAESGVKVQFAPDSAGMPDRQCTLTGSPEGIAKAKALITRFISSKAKELNSRGMDKPGGRAGGGMGDGVVMEEIMIPGNKVGIVIGKGGEKIKHLQDSAGVKLVMIQDSNAPSGSDKPLRITGEPQRVQRAKEMVFELLAEKDAQGAQYGGGGNGRGCEIPVPRNLVGVIIGRGGEMIKKIQAETGARVQFKADDGAGPQRQCSVSGTPDCVKKAAEMIQNLLDTTMAKHNGQGGGCDPGRGRDETTFIVPADRTGRVIGKGGETIKEIARMSGARVQLDRDQQSNPNERVFRVQGNPDQIQAAVQMVAEKAGIPADQNGGGGHPGNGYGGPGGFGGQSVPQGWGNAYQQWGQTPQQPQQASDQNSAAWAAYYQQYYQQQGAYQGQQQAVQQQAAQQQAPGQQAPQQQAPQQQAPGQQADYSAAWAEYYRQQAAAQSQGGQQQ